MGAEADGCVVSNAACPPPAHLCPICRRREPLREELPPRRSCLDASRSCRVDRPCARLSREITCRSRFGHLREIFFEPSFLTEPYERYCGSKKSRCSTKGIHPMVDISS